MTARSCGSAASISTASGYDLLGLMIGSEGLLGIVTEVTVRLLRKPSTARAVLIGLPTEARRGRMRRGDHRGRASSPAAWR